MVAPSANVSQCLAFMRNPDPESLQPLEDVPTCAASLEDLKLIWTSKTKTKDESRLTGFRRRLAHSKYPGAFTNAAGETLLINAATNANLRNPDRAPFTLRAPHPWQPARQPLPNVGPIDPRLKPSHPPGAEHFFDLAIIDILKYGIPLGQASHTSFVVNTNAPLAAKHKAFLKQQIEAVLIEGTVAKVCKKQNFQERLQAKGFTNGYVSFLGVFDRNEFKDEVTRPMQSPKWSAERAHLEVQLPKPPKLRKIDNLSAPDKGGKKTRSDRRMSVNGRTIFNSIIRYSQLGEAVIKIRANGPFGKC